MHAQRLALALASLALQACFMVPAARNSFGTTVRDAGGYDDPSGPDLLFFELHGIAGRRDGVHGLPIREGWRELPRTTRRRDGTARLAELLDGRLLEIGDDHPAGLRRFSAEGSPAEWRPSRNALNVDWYPDLSGPARRADYAVKVRADGEERDVDVYGRDGDEWVLLQRLRLRSSRTGAGWILGRALVYPVAWAVDATLVAVPVAGGLWLTYYLVIVLPAALTGG